MGENKIPTVKVSKRWETEWKRATRNSGHGLEGRCDKTYVARGHHGGLGDHSTQKVSDMGRGEEG